MIFCSLGGNFTPFEPIILGRSCFFRSFQKLWFRLDVFSWKHIKITLKIITKSDFVLFFREIAIHGTTRHGTNRDHGRARSTIHDHHIKIYDGRKMNDVYHSIRFYTCSAAGEFFDTLSTDFTPEGLSRPGLGRGSLIFKMGGWGVLGGHIFPPNGGFCGGNS